LRGVWKASEQEEPHTAALFKLYLLTAQRGGELRAMEWSELDLDAGCWTIPAEKAKNKLAHRVPLSPQAVVILRGLQAHAKGSPRGRGGSTRSGPARRRRRSSSCGAREGGGGCARRFPGL